MTNKTKYFIGGIAALFLVKYVIIGLDRWNNIFHPGRTEGPDVVKFRKGVL